MSFNALDDCKSQLTKLGLVLGLLVTHFIEQNIGQLTQSLNIMNGRERTGKNDRDNHIIKDFTAAH